MSLQKVITGLHMQARLLVGQKVNVKMEDKDYDKVMVVEDVKFNRKPKIMDNTVSLQVRLRFADMRYSDVILKTVIPQS
jgi:hypothetical protein